jgi:hypothetical protein
VAGPAISTAVSAASRTRMMIRVGLRVTIGFQHAGGREGAPGRD